MKRLFAAIAIPPQPAFDQLLDLFQLTFAHEHIKWIDCQHAHLTLKFFGETPEDRIPAIVAALQQASAGRLPIPLGLGRIGIFGSQYQPRVIWLGVQGGDALQHLATAIFDQLENAGWPRDRQNFVPHLTLGRIKQLNDKALFQKLIRRFSAVEVQHTLAERVTLFESKLHPHGPEYQILWQNT